MNTITAQDVDVILEAELASHDPAAPARLFTVLQGLLTPTAQQTSKNVVYLHRGINATKRVFFRALCVALGGCGWVTASSLDDATKLLSGYKQRERYPALLVLDNIPSGTLVEWRHLMSLAATPGVQIHALQDIAWPHEHLALPTASVEQYDWRDISGNAVVLRDDAVLALAPAIASWLGIVGAAHPADTASLCASPDEVYLSTEHLANVPPSARSPRRPLLSSTPALWSLGGACANDAAKLLPAEPETSRTTPQIACRKDPCLASARSAPAVLHIGHGVGCDEDHSKAATRTIYFDDVRPVMPLGTNVPPPRPRLESAFGWWEETAPTPSVSSSATTTPIDAPSSVSPSAATWPQESATTATQDSTHSSAETAKPSGDTATPPGDFIIIHGVKLPLMKISTTLTRNGVSVVNATLGLFKDEHTDWWENYRSIKDHLIPTEVGAHQLVPVQHDSLSALGITTLLFIRVSTPREVRGRYEVALEGVPPRQRSAEGLPRPLAVMQARAAATAVYPGAGTGDSDARYYTALALAGEAGEVAGKASKVLRDGESSALMEALYAELGDVLWHWLQACAEWGAQPDQVAEAMFQRLQDRQARGKLRGSGDAR